jgi:hypothetical protein
VTASLLTQLWSITELVKIPGQPYAIQEPPEDSKNNSNRYLAENLVELTNTRENTNNLHFYRLCKKQQQGKVAFLYSKRDFYENSTAERLKMAINEETETIEIENEERNLELIKYPGRLNTQNGTLLCLKENKAILEKNLEKEERKKEKKRINTEKKDSMIQGSRLLMLVMKKYGWVSEDTEIPTVPQLKQFLKAHEIVGLSKSKKIQLLEKSNNLIGGHTLEDSNFWKLGPLRTPDEVNVLEKVMNPLQDYSLDDINFWKLGSLSPPAVALDLNESYGFERFKDELSDETLSIEN